MITLAIDTSEARGSVALLTGGECAAVEVHADGSDYSEWLIPAVQRVLERVGCRMDSVELYAVATGPGSFTGVRVGLTTVKAWCEVYGKPVVGVSRLEALARCGGRPAGLMAVYYDAQRGQVFGALYRDNDGRLGTVGDEMAIAPEAFLKLAAKEAGNGAIQWASLDAGLITGLAGWSERVKIGDDMRECSPELAGEIGGIAEERAGRGEFSDLLELDANYVRRSDAEIFWKGPAAHVR